MKERWEPVDKGESFASVTLKTGFVDLEEAQIGPRNEPSKLNQNPRRGVADEAHDVADRDVKHGKILDSELKSAAENLDLVLWDKLCESNEECSLQCLKAMELNAPDQHLLAKDAEQEKLQAPGDDVATHKDNSRELDQLDSAILPFQIPRC